MTGETKILLLLFLAAGVVFLIFWRGKRRRRQEEAAAEAARPPEDSGAVEPAPVEVFPEQPAEEAAAKTARPPEDSGAVEPAPVEVFPEQPAEEAAAETARPPEDSGAARQRKHSRKKPRKYGGLAHKPPEPQEMGTVVSRGEGEDTKRDRSLPIEIRLLERGGFCTVSLIARRSSSLPEDLAVVTQSGVLDLRALQEEWYQDVTPSDIASILRDGAVWSQEGTNSHCNWSLSGRELYVLAERTDLRGYVSQARLELGRKHAVLCSENLRETIEEAIRAAGAEPAAVFDASLGAPAGWVVFKGILPTIPVAPTEEADILNALRPLAKIDISLDGGIRLEYTTWIEGYPPLIHVYGDPGHTDEVLIDGRVAKYVEDGAYQAPGWDSVGSHNIWCGGTRKTYSIEPFSAFWERWDAYVFPAAYGLNKNLSICGPLVQVKSGELSSQTVSIVVPETNPVLLGSVSGHYVVASRVSAVRGCPCISSPSFRPVWALPRDPLHCDKEAVFILLVGDELSPDMRGLDCRGASHSEGTDIDSTYIDLWCRKIMDASRKGLRTKPNNERIQGLWHSYKREARRIWRARK
jgi:hypothetical protein